MEAIMQGTTPSLTITIKDTDFLLSNVSKVELYVQNGKQIRTYTDADLTIDTEENTVTKKFTEEETSAFTRKTTLVVQARFFFPDNSVIGINKLQFAVSDMLGVGD